ncbi:cysteine-rich protein 2-binding protein [Lates japonicus]|uniref:Cysteine-rich protein 2-binding protein n=1 Tax=Lates japonicus TaxID=270547 RepID=A0AAD3RI18_LATJO|nr:cysteine-rich protein 2-binding protein [Lates japonicus]
MDSSSEQLGGGEDEAACTSASEGLEEGEVEGETLLIVESEDQGSVDLSHDQSGDSLTSDVGEEADGGWACEDMSFYCDRCHKWIPAAQLCGEQPSYLKGDNFFKFICSDCSEDGKESFERMRLTWQQVVMLAMYNLSLEGTGRQGYFRWKEDICAFIGRHWNFLLGTRKKTSTWWSTVAGCLSVGSPTFFRSGAQEFGEPGWWKLVQNRPPTLRPDVDKSTTKTKASKPAVDPIITVEGLRKRGARNPVENAMQLKEKRSRTQEAKDIRRAQKEAVGGYTDRSASSTPVKLGGGRGGSSGRRPDLILEKGEVIDFSSLSSSDRTPLTSPSPSPSPDFSAPGTPASHSATPSLLSEADLIPDAMPPQALFHDDEEMETEGMIDPGMEYIPPPSASLVARKKLHPAPPHIKREAESEDDEGRQREDDFEEPVGRGVGLHRKLLVRQAKRQRGLPLLDIDRAVSATLSLVGGIYGAQEAGTLMGGGVMGKYCTNSQELRILDRFQTNLSNRRGVQQHSVSFWHRLMGRGQFGPEHQESVYVPHLKTLHQIGEAEGCWRRSGLPSRIKPDWVPGPGAPHRLLLVHFVPIPSVNAMCLTASGPGVDLSECLQYPDFNSESSIRKWWLALAS